MNFKKFKSICSAALLSLLIPSGTAAATVYVYQLTQYTYATSTHPDNYTADSYTGLVSVRGADRLIVGNKVCYPTYSQITYNVQGTPYQKTVYSQGKSDYQVRTATIVVKDYWNIGPKTQVYGGYGYGETGEAVSSIIETVVE